MNRQNIRLFFFFTLFFVGMLLYTAWQQEKMVLAPPPVNEPIAKDSHQLPLPPAEENKTTPLKINAELTEDRQAVLLSQRLISVFTDVYKIKIDPLGGDIVYLELLAYPQDINSTTQGHILLDHQAEYFYVAESGLLSQGGPDIPLEGKGLYQTAAKTFYLDPEQEQLRVDLQHRTPAGVEVTKRFSFTRGAYAINVEYIVNNQSNTLYKANVFARLKRKLPETSRAGLFGAMKTYTGAAVKTPETLYEKLPFDKLSKKPFYLHMEGGWAAMVEHYFTSAWIPDATQKHHYEGKKLSDELYTIGFTSNVAQVPAGQQQRLAMQLYAGPEITDVLKAVSPGLELTVDYGVLWWLCQPIFWVLKTINDYIGNWGGAIILTTLLIKALFYKLSAASYRSMGNMRKLQPKINALKERYGDDKQKFGQAMMELYRREKINPLGGCLPVLLQIPVFIALYYVLLESVELRQAPFMLWIHDLSAKDPYYVLPIIMGASMFVQQQLNPTPPDPIQAKVMMFMPLFFTVLFLQFPAGLVLYWVVNNLLSILQQWMITRRIETEGRT